MPQLAFNLDGPPEPFKRAGARQSSVVYARAPLVVRWKTGAPDAIPDHMSAVVLPGTSKRVDLTVVPYVICTYQGAGTLFLAPGDDANNLDVVLPGGSQWGQLGWVDASGVHDFQQY